MAATLSMAEYRLLIEHAPVMIWRSRLDAKCDYFNDVWLAFTGRTLEQESGDGWAEGVHPDDLEPCVRTYLDHFHRREPFEMEYRLRRHDGVYRWLFDRGVPYHDDTGAFAGFIGSCVDVDDRRRVQEERETYEQRELHVAREFERLILAIVSHDIRNPLTAITTSSQVLMRRASRDPGTRDIASRISRSTERITSIVRDLLDVTLERQGGGIPIVRGPADLTMICRQAIEEIAISSGCAIVLHADGSVSGSWDANRLAQAVSNLIDNARKHGAPDQLVNVHVRTDDTNAIVEVHNEGVISPEVMRTLFEPFATSRERTPGRGLGLGLFIARSIARAHRGDLRVVASPPDGTVFRIILPRFA